MTGYIKATIDFPKIERMLEAAKALYSASEEEKAKDIIKKMAESIIEEIN